MRRTPRSPHVVITLAAATLIAGCGVAQLLDPDPVEFTLTLTQEGDGTVTSSPGSVSTTESGGSNSGAFNDGTSVTLTATAAAGWELSSWGGACVSATGTTCDLTMNANQSASATFTEVVVGNQFTLAVSQTGDGMITSSPAGISTNASGGMSSADFDEGSSVTLTATPASGWELSGWGDDCATATTTCTLTMDAGQTASATFTPVAANQFTLNVTKSGNGTVTSSPAGISIPSGGAAGAFTYDEGTVVTLTATPDAGWRIAAWSGAGCAGTGTCDVTMDANQSVSLVLELIPTGSDLSTGVPVPGLAGTAGSSQTYKLAVPSGASSVRFEIRGGTGEVNLRSRFGAEPTFSDFDCRPGQAGNDESCNHGNPAGGDWFAQVTGIDDYSGVTLTGYYQVDPAGYSIQIVFDASTSGWTAAEVASVTAGIRRWEDVITTDLDGSWSSGGCGTTGVDEYVDDFLIYVTQGPIDGPSNTQAQAGYCSRRQVTDAVFFPANWYTGYENTLPYFGNMNFDEDDVSSAQASGRLADIATHEMGHALGLLPLADDPEFDQIQGPDASPFHNGTATIAAFNAAGGIGSEVPVEPVVRAHWDENDFDDELMTPTIMGGDALPLSAISAAALEDLGYVVDLGQTDAYTFPSPAAPVAGATDKVVQVYMINDILWYQPRRVVPQPEPRRQQ